MGLAVGPLFDALDELGAMTLAATNGWIASVLLGWGVRLADLIECQKECLEALEGVQTTLEPTLKVLRSTAFKHSKAFCFACGESLLLDGGQWVGSDGEASCGDSGVSEHVARFIA